MKVDAAVDCFDWCPGLDSRNTAFKDVGGSGGRWDMERVERWIGGAIEVDRGALA